MVRKNSFPNVKSDLSALNKLRSKKLIGRLKSRAFGAIKAIVPRGFRSLEVKRKIS